LNLIGTLFKEDGKYVICNSIVEIESELFISHNVRINREEIFDLSAYGIEACTFSPKQVFILIIYIKRKK
jgi:hypothetical protein